MSDVINCEACNGLVSKKVKTCPHCGHKNKSGVGFFGWCGIIILLLGVYGSLLPKDPQKQAAAMANTKYRQDCSNLIKASVNHPSTLNIHSFSGYAEKTTGNKTIIQQDFSAKNGFGAKFTHSAFCTFENGELVDFVTRERGY